MVDEPLGKIHSSEGSFSNFLLGFEKLMEIPLVYSLGQKRNPLLQNCWGVTIELESIVIGPLFQSDAIGKPRSPFVWPVSPQDLEFKLEIDFAVEIGFFFLNVLA